ncbi:MAG: carboxypeptidase-like regulatory domain-containing protein [Pirellulales bacterium]|nr:carboxypeptidase-like regulatory domain-containing protein [Pirellulales bacterium]
MFRLQHTLTLVLLLLPAAGCGDAKGPLRVPVVGTVTLDGAPLSAAVLEFFPLSQVAGNGGHGRTGSSGRYEVATWQGKEGLPPGDYLVTIEKRVMPDGSDFPFDSDDWPDKSVTRQILPAKYAAAKKSELKVTVAEDKPVYDLILESR